MSVNFVDWFLHIICFVFWMRDGMEDADIPNFYIVLTHIPPRRGRLLLGRQCNESQHQRGNNNSISSGGRAICLARYAQLKGGDAVAS